MKEAWTNRITGIKSHPATQRLSQTASTVAADVDRAVRSVASRGGVKSKANDPPAGDAETHRVSHSKRFDGWTGYQTREFYFHPTMFNTSGGHAQRMTGLRQVERTC